MYNSQIFNIKDKMDEFVITVFLVTLMLPVLAFVLVVAKMFFSMIIRTIKEIIKEAKDEISSNEKEFNTIVDLLEYKNNREGW